MNAIHRAWNEADSAHFMSWCIQLTATLAKQMAAEGKCDPQLYESLKAMQLIVDRELHAMKKEENNTTRYSILQEIQNQYK